jgi:hypothetical protein
MAPGQEIAFARGKLRVAHINSNGTVVLVCPLTGNETQVSLPEIMSWHLEGKARLAPAPDAADTVSGKFRRKQGPVDPNRQALVARRIAYVNPLVALGHVRPGHPAVATCIAEVAQRIGDRAPPAPWTTYRWLRRYRNAGFDPDVLARDAMFVRVRQPKIAPEVKEILARHVQALMAAYKSVSLHAVTNLALALTARDLGKEYFRAIDGQEHLALTFIPVAEEVLAARAAGHRASAKRQTDKRTSGRRSSKPAPSTQLTSDSP